MFLIETLASVSCLWYKFLYGLVLHSIKYKNTEQKFTEPPRVNTDMVHLVLNVYIHGNIIDLRAYVYGVVVVYIVTLRIVAAEAVGIYLWAYECTCTL